MKTIYLLAPIFLLGCTQLPTKGQRKSSMPVNSAVTVASDQNEEKQFHKDRQKLLSKKTNQGSPETTAKALYDSGLQALKLKQYGQAIKIFNLISEKYPTTKSASRALWAKGVAFQRMNLMAQATEVWTHLRLRYPNSREAKFAKAELERRPGVRR